jgi:hypothetical protein
VTSSVRQFNYLTDPICIASLILYTINRFLLKPYRIGGWFTHGYLNDVLCLSLFVPIILYIQRIFGIRQHDRYPLAWEILQQWVIFSILFQAILPRFPKVFAGAGDPWDILAYFTGGLLAGIYWSAQSRRRLHTTKELTPQPQP